MENDIRLTDLLDVGTLQSIQDSFCKMTGIAAGVCDADGVAITKDSLSTDFCMNFNKKSKVGRKRCEMCDKRGGELALKEGKSVAYRCHTGMVDFAAPIIEDGKVLGSFVGGQVRVDDIDEEKLAKIADEIGVDRDEYIAAARRTKKMDARTISNCAEFVYKVSNILSEMAASKYRAKQAKKELEHVAKMKSDFLANMSHEIRTPMNAIIGMAEMALRENLPEDARGYVSQIKTSGNALLNIINDILDFSKIESGKVDIIVDNYEPYELAENVINMVKNKVKGKEVDLRLNLSPEIPVALEGDFNRINQIVLNIVNNAVKFTSKGQVVLHMDFDNHRDGTGVLIVAVEDTGIGIRKEDLNKIFETFQQVDSKRNRNIEGTGLGLAISKRLLDLMHGTIDVESEYGKGTLFTVRIPQKVKNSFASVRLKYVPAVCYGRIANPYVEEQLGLDVSHLNIPWKKITFVDDIVDGTNAYLFIEDKLFTEKEKQFLQSHPELTGVVIQENPKNGKTWPAQVRVLTKPVDVRHLAAVFNHEEVKMMSEDEAFSDYRFTAPEAQILVVDDNAVNLTVTQGLLKPLEMKIDTASSGREALAMIREKQYDLIFMDHMMPEMDGVETTHMIRRFHKNYMSTPIIALTANAMDGSRDMFLKEGLNDYIPKPIEMKEITDKLEIWLPEDKIERIGKAEKRQEMVSTFTRIEGLDTQSAIRRIGDESLYQTVLKSYYKVIDKKAALISEYEKKEDWKNYTVEVHALKSASRQIGADKLADLAASLETAGNAGSATLIHVQTGRLLEMYQGYKEILAPFCRELESAGTGKKRIKKEELLGKLEAFTEALDNLDMDEMEKIIKNLSEYHYSEIEKIFLRDLSDYADEMDIENCERTITNWKEEIR